MNKSKIKTKLLELEHGDIESAVKSYESYFGEATMERDRTVDFEHSSTVVRDRPVLESLEGLIHEHENHLEIINSISFDEKETVEPGAVVELNKNRFFVIAVLTDEFECEGNNLMGISTQSPLYDAIKGLSAGDDFEIHDKTFEISAIY